MTPKSITNRLNQGGNFLIKFILFVAGIAYLVKYVFPLEIHDFHEKMTLLLEGVGSETHNGIHALKRNYCDRDKHNTCACVALLPGLADEALTYRELLKLPEHDWKNENIKLFAIDPPGNGSSKAPEDPEEYTIAAMADAMTRFLSATDCKKIVVAGHSFGARIAAEMVRKTPEKYDSLLLIAPAGASTGVTSDTESFFMAPTASGLRQFLNLAYASPRSYSDELLAAAAKKIAQSNAKAVLTMNQQSPPIENALGIIRQPALVLWGESDHITDPSQGKLLASKLINGRLYVEPKCGHLMQKECPTIIRDAIMTLVTMAPGSIPEIRR